MPARTQIFRREAASPAPGARPTWHITKTTATTERLEGTYPSGMKEAETRRYLLGNSVLGGHFTEYRNGCFTFIRNTD